MIYNSQTTLFDTLTKTEHFGKGNLHKSIVKIEKMTSSESKNKGENLIINYDFYVTLFGDILIASTEKGICHLGFSDNKEEAFKDLKGRFHNAKFIQKSTKFQENTLKIFSLNWSKVNKIKLHLKGTDFQLKVWEILLRIPLASLSTYGQIASEIDKPNAARAVGTAIGRNPIAFIIPCHRVIQTSGALGGYMWGITRKAEIIRWEATLNMES